MQKAQAEDYLSSLLNKSLRITIADTRMFVGIFKCTDPVCALHPPLVHNILNHSDRTVISFSLRRLNIAFRHLQSHLQDIHPSNWI